MKDINLGIEDMTKMLEMRDDTNTIESGVNWNAVGHSWRVGVAQELSEVMDALGWAWWKPAKCDMAEARLELIDVWMFFHSYLLNIDKDRGTNYAPQILFDAFAKPLTLESVSYNDVVDAVYAIQHMTLSTAISLKTYAVRLRKLNYILGMNDANFQMLYVAKNTLNTFRQNWGYGTGVYSKTWNGESDTKHLMRILTTGKEPKTPEYITEQLKDTYYKYNV